MKGDKICKLVTTDFGEGKFLIYDLVLKSTTLQRPTGLDDSNLMILHILTKTNGQKTAKSPTVVMSPSLHLTSYRT